MPSYSKPKENVFTRSLPGPLKGLVESVFPADDLGIAPTPLTGVIEKSLAPVIAGVTPKLAKASPYLPNLPEFVPVGMEEVFNAGRSGAIPKVSGRIFDGMKDPNISRTLNDILSDVGFEGLRKLQQHPIPQKLVQAPPRMK